MLVRFHFDAIVRGQPSWWLVLDGGEADVCLSDPGFVVDVAVEADLRSMIMVWMGDRTFEDAVRTGALRLAGPLYLRTLAVLGFVLTRATGPELAWAAGEVNRLLQTGRLAARVAHVLPLAAAATRAPPGGVGPGARQGRPRPVARVPEVTPGFGELSYWFSER